MNTVNILFIGDIVGKPGRAIIKDHLNEIVRQFSVDCVIANCENAAGGMSITPEIAQELFSYGIHILTTGNHIFNNRTIIKLLETNHAILRPANFPHGVPGCGYTILNVNTINIAVVNLIGRINMEPVNCPFITYDMLHEEIKQKSSIIIIDFHAEATSEKKAFGWFVDGRATAVCGTHTHVQTADETILPNGTAYITDVGMTGPFDSVIGMDKESSIHNFIYHTRIKFKVAQNDPTLNAVLITCNIDGKAKSITRIIKSYELSPSNT
ncbi:MAG: TIGR00282 family metallophosphoesterase [Spirochaetes bacterium]|nr:TIGR00282 family metallophosphoesterase [Spirochaetota bacterium]